MSDIPKVSRSRRGGAPTPPPAPEDEWPEDTTPEERAAVEEHRFPCPACGSDLRFSADAGDLVCDHCGYVEHVAATGRAQQDEALRELDYEAALRNQVPADEVIEVRAVHCESCGADVEMSGVEQAKECPFCASPIVTDTGTSRHLKPQALLPFALDEKTARGKMTDWLGRLWFAPNGLKEYARKGRKMKGIYVPYWTYDADTRSRYTGQRGDDYYTTRTVMRDGKRVTERVRKTRWTRVSGRVARDFDDVLVLASDSLPRDYTDALEPWDLGELKPYSPEYLAGYIAEGYSVDLEPGYAIARHKMDAVIASDIRRDIGGDHQRIGDVQTAVSDVTFKHILLPVWLAAYKFKGKSYRFVVNARSGEVKGERPYSPWKIFFAALLAVIVIGGLIYLNQGG
ncbi:RNA polymerase I specific transcription initiation factor RRN7 [Aliiruegeria haliotis]|uniref:RNA polymerase I specific transcription initiation factor RRN7 n=1 Tax=Aliiruegeria haliotis TaxID=1280846 RepID=A0A2T0RW47_9RHOB|nr:TFIIB-type zinc finger domain-containing protein [Aliiruegeria haliotis]PRY25377.1 RNA polymerase I specific transcription initiation factor RRN7 [Aliiruegeria haliotis]